MTPDVEKNHFLFGNQQGQSDAIAACEAGRVATGKDAGRGVEFKMGREGVVFQVSQQLAEARIQIGMFFKNFRACRRNCCGVVRVNITPVLECLFCPLKMRKSLKTI